MIVNDNQLQPNGENDPEFIENEIRHGLFTFLLMFLLIALIAYFVR